MNKIAAISCVTVASAVQWLRATSLVAAAEKVSAFVIGKGSGSGWDCAGEAKAVMRFIRTPAPIIFDVGANNGEWAICLAQHLKSPDARFHLFECSPYVLPHLPQRLPRIPNPTTIEAAVSDTDGEIQLHTPNRGSGLASVHARRDVGVKQETYETVTVRSVTIDSYVRENQIDRVDLMKMDIEGHELAALRGASDCLSKGVIRTLTFEFGSANVNSRTFFRDFWDLLTGHGYGLYRMVAGGHVVAIRHYGEDLEYFRGATNYIAHRPG